MVTFGVQLASLNLSALKLGSGTMRGYDLIPRASLIFQSTAYWNKRLFNTAAGEESYYKLVEIRSCNGPIIGPCAGKQYL